MSGYGVGDVGGFLAATVAEQLNRRKRREQRVEGGGHWSEVIGGLVRGMVCWSPGFSLPSVSLELRSGLKAVLQRFLYLKGHCGALLGVFSEG